MLRKSEDQCSTTVLSFAVGIAALVAGFVLLATPSSPVMRMPTEKASTSLSHIEEGGPVASVLVPATMSEQALIGKAIFDANCADCHGDSAAGVNGLAPPLIHQIYVPSHHADRTFYAAVANGVRGHHWPFGDMPAIKGVSQDEVKEIITYIRELQRANGIQ